MIFPKDNWKTYEKRVSSELEDLGNQILKGLKERIGKVFFLKDFEEFSSKYSFMCIPDQASPK